MSEIDLPPGIGPHEGKEYQLMVEGKKHVAMFSDYIPEQFVNNPKNLPIKKVHVRSAEDERMSTTIFYLPGYLSSVERLLELNAQCVGVGFIEEYERPIGRILGYQDWEIDAFLKHMNNHHST